MGWKITTIDTPIYLDSQTFLHRLQLNVVHEKKMKLI